MYFTPEEDAVEVVFGSRRLRVERFSLRAADWIAEACRRLTRNLDEVEWARYLPGIPYAASCEALTAAPATTAHQAAGRSKPRHWPCGLTVAAGLRCAKSSGT